MNLKANLVVMKNLALLLTLFLTAVCDAQIYSMEGKIVDAATMETIPFAHITIKVEDQKRGLISDLEGNFVIKTNVSEHKVIVTAIGYKSLTTTIKNGTFNIVKLQPDIFSLDQVVITNVDKEREMLKKVLQRLSTNYPNKLERLHGRIVEILAMDSLYSRPIYTADAKVEVDKYPYTQKHSYGNVKIVDGEVLYSKPPELASRRIYAGIHNVHRFDILTQRFEPFDNIDDKEYQFEIVDTLAYDQRALFKMRFETSAYQGHLYIEDGTYALVKSEYNARKKTLNRSLSGTDRLFLNFSTEYVKTDSLYRLSYINYRTAFSNSIDDEGDNRYLNNYFYLEKAEPTDKLLLSSQVNDFADVLIEKLPINSIHNKTDSIALNNLTAPQNSESRFFSLIKLLNFSTKLGWVTNNATFTSLGINSNNLNEDLTGASRVALSTSFGYEFNNNLNLVYTNTAAFKRENISSHSLQIKWSKPFFRNKRWRLGLSSGLNFTDINMDRGAVQLNQQFFESSLVLSPGSYTVEQNTSQFNFIPGLFINYRLNGRLFVEASIDLPFNLSTEGEMILIKPGDENRSTLPVSQKNFAYSNILFAGIGIFIKL